MKIAITAESTIDLTPEIKKEFDIKTVSFTILIGEETKLDEEVSCREMFDFAKKNKTLPKTSAVNEFQYEEFFNSILKDYDAIIHFSLSSEISSAYFNAVKVSEKMKNVYVIDSRTLSTAIALLAINARNMVNQGIEIEKIVKTMKERTEYAQASFVINKLDYLHKGGRCSSLQLLGANLLQLRPQIIVTEGKMKMKRKYRGDLEKNVIENYCRDTLAEFNTPDLNYAFVTYTTATDNMIEKAKNALKNRGFKRIFVTTAGATISSHCGENTLGILYMNDGEQK